MDDSETIPDDALSLYRAFQYCMAVISFVGLLVLFFLISLEKAAQHQTWLQAVNRFNILLVIKCVCQIILHIAIGLRCWSSCPSVAFGVITYALENGAIYTMAQCYILFLWMRASDVIKKVFPKSMCYFQYIVQISPLIFVSTFISDVYLSWDQHAHSESQASDTSVLFNTILSLLASGTAVVFDLITLTTFLRYLYRISRDAEIRLDSHLRTIAQFGVLTSSIALTSFVFNVVELMYTPGTKIQVLLYYATITWIDLVLFLLIGMKARLIVVRARRDSNVNISAREVNSTKCDSVRDSTTPKDGTKSPTSSSFSPKMGLSPKMGRSMLNISRSYSDGRVLSR
ncbi:hypothetical protein BCR33DRAFT_724434 [Rhizoclosmatium globosum]|uniref:Uncharacterized protein n=1 Tax=Rhizoclosmatium globosum TaxID=329046 RepID=A0A1Y2B6M3_9FUNG|nr:hypothetical protein BCR33DRAFT_724434 [Rhizoclosmatium globosum]|eukprot:ORY30117.1 hypothetical protein BCR33DRAFT_724434 [Rhizoclosmatium globosum]